MCRILDGDFAANSVESWKGQYTGLQLRFDWFGLGRTCAAAGKVSAKHTSDVKKRATAAYEAFVMGAVADTITVSA
jgi:hypothetical protein